MRSASACSSGVDYRTNEYGELPVDPPYDTARTTAVYCPTGSAEIIQPISTRQVPELSTAGFPKSMARIDTVAFRYTSNS